MRDEQLSLVLLIRALRSELKHEIERARRLCLESKALCIQITRAAEGPQPVSRPQLTTGAWWRTGVAQRGRRRRPHQVPPGLTTTATVLRPAGTPALVYRGGQHP